MTRTGLDKRFFETTRGRIVTLLRAGSQTVNQLAGELELTDNAVRAHLLSLERDGLVKQSGIQRGIRKPHFAYELSEEAEHLFPKAYDALLNQLLAVLKQRLKPAALEEVLREVGRSFARAQGSEHNAKLEKRVGGAVNTLEALGGVPRVEKKNEKFSINSERCPFATAVAEHPEVCTLAEALLSEIIGTEVHERCDRAKSSRCHFEILNK